MVPIVKETISLIPHNFNLRGYGTRNTEILSTPIIHKNKRSYRTTEFSSVVKKQLPLLFKPFMQTQHNTYVLCIENP